jgi:hypothetical protein
MNILVYGDKQMNTTKILIAAVAVTALALVAIGLASAQLQANQTYTGTTAPDGGGFLGWIGRCFGFGPQYYGTTAPAYQAPLQANITVTDPNTNQTTTYQGYYGYGMPFYKGYPQNVTAPNPYNGATTAYSGYYGYGGCMGGFYP